MLSRLAIVPCLLLPAFAHAASLTFEKDVRPILKTHCFHCHGEDNETKGGLDTRLARLMIKGGEHGAAIVPGKPAESRLVSFVKEGKMPKGKAHLTAAQVDTIEQWVAQGAVTAKPEPGKPGPETAFTDEERAWWSFQPIKAPKVPALPTTKQNPIDAFIAAKLSENKLTFSPQADARTLVRRITFDLTGLPPTPEAVQQFEQDSIRNPQAAIRELTERLLASTAYGEAWGRHWLDVAGYADSDGYTESDAERKHAWKYRDYVIESLNDDKPFDQFMREQLAGDEIAAREQLTANSPTAEQRARYEELLRATGFLRMAPDGTGSMNDVTSRNACVADTIKIVSTAVYGMTIGCAQCHDHRYDPITQADYYRLRAIFEPGFDTQHWRSPASRLVSLLTNEQKAAGATFEDAAKKIDAERLKKQEAFIAEVLDKELEKAPEALRKDLRTAYTMEIKKRTPAMTKLLKDWPRINQLSAGSLYLYDSTYKTKHADELKKLTEVAAAERAKKPKEEFVQAFTEVPTKTAETVPATFVFNRGNPEQPKDKVEPGDLSILAGSRKIDVPGKNPALPSSGRRLAYAESVTDGKHPLLARVIVNRVWMQHFGKGLVGSVADFGALGDKPTHPELLDWLAADFMRNGWSLKHLHRLIVSSQTYQQSSRRDAERERIDPDNHFLSRMNVRRMEAETLRDSLLAVAGKLNTRIAGSPVPVMFNEEGQVVIGADTTDTAGRQTGKYIPLNGEEFRRSIYVQIRRTRPLEMFAAFDAPAMTDANCQSRPVTTVSPQSLLLMNNGYMREAAQFFAVRVATEAGDDVRQQAERAFQLAYSRAPSMAEIDSAVQFVREQTKHYEANPVKFERVTGPADKENAKPEMLGLAALCHALMSANEFLYVD